MSDATPFQPLGPSAEPAPRHDLLAVLRDPQTIRLRCAAITRAVDDGRSPHFTIDRDRLDDAARRVADLTHERFPDGVIPFHSRWRHFEAGGVDRKAELDAALAGRPPADLARARIDLTVISVLLDAGAGATWRYTERPGGLDATALPPQQVGSDDLLALLDQVAPGKGAAAGAVAPDRAVAVAPPPGDAAVGGVFQRSEGLGVASFRAFMAGAFSSTKAQPWRADAQALKQVDASVLRTVFQVTPANPMVGLEGRAGLLSRLGDALHAQASGTDHEARPGLLYDQLTSGGQRSEVSATEVLRWLLQAFGPIWTSGWRISGLPAGDAWPHRWAGSATPSGMPDATTLGWVPFHKLSQWMTYSLIEPLQWAGVRVTGLDALTGLPEYRNGGLLIDCGVIVPRHPSELRKPCKAGDEIIIEWRALTVSLLDELADRVRALLGKTAAELPLACILEGGTWAAGRRIAGELRDGAPPLSVDSDGTVF